MATIIDSLKRLERAGSEHSRATQKLHDAVRDVAALIIDNAPRDVELPRGYIVRDVHSNVGAESFLHRKTGRYDYFTEVEEIINYDGPRYLHGDFSCDMSSQRQSREKSLRFAKDVAEGLLEEIAAFLERRAAEASTATNTLAEKLP